MSLVLVMLTHPMNCHPEAAEALARERLPTKDLCTSWTEGEKNRVPHFSRSLREVG
jgi:hypothetical protein